VKRFPFKCPAKGIALGILTAGIFIGLFTGTEQAQNAPAAGTQAAPVGNAENGKKLFNTVGCWMCHGYSGQGGTGARIAPDPIALPAFIQYIRAPKAQMPPYTTKVLKDSDLADIHAFLKTIPKLPDPESIPLLKGSSD
jgi:ubiquinol-cytochrome c reductase cytochrome c subunit